MRIRSAVLVAVLGVVLAGCGADAPAKPKADAQILVYNSTGMTIKITHPGDPSSGDPEFAGPQTKTIPAYKSAIVYCFEARRFPIQLVEPENDGRYNQSLEIAADSKANLLIDIGGRGQFYKYPIAYGRFADQNKTVPPEFYQQFPVQELKGAKGVYELDQRFSGINKAPPSKVTAPPAGNLAAVYVLVDASGLRRVSEGQPLDRE